MAKLIYITHPQVEINANTPIDQWEISKEGYKAIERLLLLDFWQEVKQVYSSEEKKAKTVAEIVSKKFSLTYQSYKEFNELDRSSTGLLPFEEYMQAVQFTYENPKKSYKGWETLESSYYRNTKKLKKIISNNPRQTLALIGHGSAGTLIKCFIQDITPTFQEDPQKVGCYFVANLDNRGLSLDWTQY